MTEEERIKLAKNLLKTANSLLKGKDISPALRRKVESLRNLANNKIPVEYYGGGGGCGSYGGGCGSYGGGCGSRGGGCGH